MILYKTQLHNILEEILSPVLVKLNMNYQGNGRWISFFENGIARIFQYSRLKGGQATFVWGLCFDFLPIPSGNQIIFHRTLKNARCHLFEWPDEYAYSFFGGDLKKGICSEWGEQEFRHSVSNLINRNKEKIFKWYESVNSVESALNIAKAQELMGKAYKYHSPSPDYIIAFLLAKLELNDQAIVHFDKNIQNKLKDDLIKNLRSKLLEMGA